MLTPSRERGATAVEFALVLPLLLLLVLGIIEFGRAYHLQTTLSNAARDGVRVMALENSVSAARSTAKASAQPLPLTNTMIRVTPSTCSGGAVPGTAWVSIDYPFTPLSGFLPIGDITLTGKGSMRCLG
ncbi:pilus assembly protein [Dietzia sp. E1]|uniref:TadE/TadG family type IV pilus assembly protein n=1 Tax=Dietzia sp. E1 TaxID=328361 RepID=UPI0015F88658|nr:TadE/TadG family type IV pilus assembly protein [Dietzia sp. E1]MBB1021338.1 pilus assembly protein [Dietzia sp. E1]